MHRRLVLPPSAIALAQGQRGLITGSQLHQQGLPRHTITRFVHLGALVKLERNVYELVGTTGGHAHDCQRAVLAIGAPIAVSDGSAARLWGFEEMGHGAIDVTVPTSRGSGRTCATVHRRPLPAIDVMQRRGLPVVTPTRLLADLVLQPYDTRFLGKLVDHLLRTRVLTVRELIQGCERLSWHLGFLPMRRLVDAHLEGVRVVGQPSGSVRETALQRLLLDRGLPAPVRQHPVDVGDRLIQVDLAYPEIKVAIEFDSFSWHCGRQSFDDDRRRVDDLQALGWRVILVTSRMTDEEVLQRITRALAERVAA